MMQDKVKKPPPRCKAILLCDQVLNDPAKQKSCLLSIFDSLVITKIPGRTRPFSIFLKLVDGIGEYQLTSELRSLRNDAVITRMPAVTIRFPDKNATINAELAHLGLPIPHEGTFDLIVFADDDEIDRCRFNVHLARGRPHQPPPIPT